MVLKDNQDQAPQQPTAASFRADSAYRGFKHWFVSYAFLPRYRTRPAGGGPLLDRQGLLPPSVPPQTSDCPSASPDRYGGRGWVLSSHLVNGASWRSTPFGTDAATTRCGSACARGHEGRAGQRRTQETRDSPPAGEPCVTVVDLLAHERGARRATCRHRPGPVAPTGCGANTIPARPWLRRDRPHPFSICGDAATSEPNGSCLLDRRRGCAGRHFRSGASPRRRRSLRRPPVRRPCGWPCAGPVTFERRIA